MERSAATCGNSARGIANTIATMSTTNDISSTGRPAMKANPSQHRAQPGRPLPGSGGIVRQPQRRVQRQREQHRIDAVGIFEAVHAGSPAAPAISGPSTCPTLLTVKVRVFAAGTSSAGTIRGTIAPRADEATAKKPAWTATSTRISGTLSNPARSAAADRA